MRKLLLAGAVLTVAVACDRRDDRAVGDTLRTSADTSIQRRTVEDTMIVRQDTLIRTDTVIRPGGVTDTARRTPPRP